MPDEEEPKPLSATAVAAHLACEHKTQLDRLVAAGRLQVEFQPDARLEALIERGDRFEREYVEQLRRDGLRVVELRHGSPVEHTLAAMREGADAIVQARLQNDRLHGYADVLRRVATPSQLGAWSYEPVDTKLATDTRAATILQLLTYAQLLADAQGTTPEHVHVVTPAGTERHRTASFAAFHRLVTGRALLARTSDPAPQTYPEPVPHCDVCNFWKHCEQRRRDDDHLSLVAGLGRAQTRELERQGVPTTAALARSGGELPERPERGHAETYRRLAHQARLQVQARDTGSVPVDFLPLEPLRGFHRLPAPSPGDLFLDFEGDPFVGNGGLEYLTGWVDTDGRYRDEWAFDAAGEKAAIEALLDAVAEARAQDPAMHVYHFAPYEPAALKRVTQRHQTRVDLLDELLRAHAFVDLRAVLKEALRVGVERYGLKQLEAVLGFDRELDLRTAAKARQRLEIALELGELEHLDDEHRAELVRHVGDYNRDDCVATRALRDWLETKRAELVQRQGEIARPPSVPDEEAQKTGERQQRVEALEAALRATLPEDPDARDDDQRAVARLADLCGYFLREQKCDWWEHHRLRELPVEDRLDEREMLAGLEYERTAPREGNERMPRHVYRFPLQETAVDGKKVYAVRDDDPEHPWGTDIGQVVAIDLDAGEVTIKRAGASKHMHPTAMFREQVVKNDVLEASLHEFAQHVLDHGIDDRTAWAPALDLLRRATPRLRDRAPGQALVDDGEDFADALARRCLALDGSLLAVQGPPGTGKSHSGAIAILELLAAGKSVGVTAVSHKVVLNLLAKVHALAAKRGLKVELNHRRDGDDAPAGVTFVSSAAANALPRPGTVLGGTAWTWAASKRESRVDHLFVDEAGQMSLAQVLAAARTANNVVLLGDPMQLEQPRRGAHPDGADTAALVHLLDPERQTLRPEQGIFLGTTWRMHPAITRFTSELYYEGRLQSLDACARQRLDGTDGFDGAGLHLLQLDHEGNQARSDEEVAAVEALVDRLLRHGATFVDRDGDRRPLTADDVLVVAPYNAQVAALQRALRAAGVTRVGTVDRFQGQEAPIVVYSCTSSSADDAPRGMSFLYDPHRFNVATSRAKACCIVVANRRLLSPECRTVEHLRMANGLCRFAELAQPVTMPDPGLSSRAPGPAR